MKTIANETDTQNKEFNSHRHFSFRFAVLLVCLCAEPLLHCCARCLSLCSHAIRSAMVQTDWMKKNPPQSHIFNRTTPKTVQYTLRSGHRRFNLIVWRISCCWRCHASAFDIRFFCFVFGIFCRLIQTHHALWNFIANLYTDHSVWIIGCWVQTVNRMNEHNGANLDL